MKRSPLTKSCVLLASVVLGCAVMSACGNDVASLPRGGSESKAGEPPPADAPEEVAGYATSGVRGVTVYFLVDQRTTLKSLRVVSQDSSSIKFKPEWSRSSGNAVSMAGYVFDTVQLSEPLGNRKVITQNGQVLDKIDPSKVYDPNAKVKRRWSPG